MSPSARRENQTEEAPPPHPAVFSDKVLQVGAELIHDQMRRWGSPLHILDPFAGTGRVHLLTALLDGTPGPANLGYTTLTAGVELEPEWAALHPRTIVGDATRLPATWTDKWDVVFTSPCYGNRFADHHDAQDGSTRRTYRHDLGRMPTPGSAAVLQWGPEYRRLHEQAWSEVRRVLRPGRSRRARGGLFVLNVKDHVRQHERQQVSRWHRDVVLALGFELVKTRRVKLAGMGFGENRDARIPFETIYAFRLHK